jgi:hypothetical protein
VSRFINVKQATAKQRCPLQTGGRPGSRPNCTEGAPRPQAFIGVCGHGDQVMCRSLLETGLCVINSSHVSVRRVPGLGWSDQAVHFPLVLGDCRSAWRLCGTCGSSTG